MTSTLRQLRRLVRPAVEVPRTAAPPTAQPAAPEPAETRAQVLRRMKLRNPTGRRPSSTTRVAVAASAHVRDGLAWEWDQSSLTPEDWREGLAGQIELLLVEIAGDGVASWPTSPAPAELADAARELGVTSVAWVTDELSGPLDLAGFDHLLVADEDLLGHLAPTQERPPRLMGPATQPRAVGGPRSPERARLGDILLLSDPAQTDEESERRRETVETLVSSLSRTELVAHDWAPGSPGSPAASDPLASAYRVLLDLGPRRPRAVSGLLDAMAARTAVVTTPDRAALLSPEIARQVAVAEADGVRRQTTVLARQPEYRERTVHRALREVVAGSTYAHRAATVLATAGKPHTPPLQERSVSVVVPTNRPHELTNVLENVARQQRAEVELVLLLHGIEIDEAEMRARARDLGVERLHLVPVPGDATLGRVLNRGLEVASGAYVAKMDDDNYYGEQFLGDLLDAFTYTSAGITGKWCHYVWLRSTRAVVLRFEQHENTYHRLVQGGSIVATREVADDIRFSDIPRAVDSDFLNRAMAAGVQTYSGDRFNFVSIRGDDRFSHTWKVDDLVFMTGAGRVVTYGDPRELVSV